MKNNKSLVVIIAVVTFLFSVGVIALATVIRSNEQNNIEVTKIEPVEFKQPETIVEVKTPDDHRAKTGENGGKSLTEQSSGQTEKTAEEYYERVNTIKTRELALPTAE